MYVCMYATLACFGAKIIPGTIKDGTELIACICGTHRSQKAWQIRSVGHVCPYRIERVQETEHASQDCCFHDVNTNNIS
jgi:hypothetical protein